MDPNHRFTGPRGKHSANGRYISHVCAVHQEICGNTRKSQDISTDSFMLRGSIRQCAGFFKPVLLVQIASTLRMSQSNRFLAKKDGL